jgi:uncharacterized protein (DUF4415 family)
MKRSSASSRRVRRVRVNGDSTKLLTPAVKRQLAALAKRKDHEIDYSDIPPVDGLDWSKAEIGKFYRPPKKAITMRLDEDVLQWLKGFGKGYQTRANALLRHAMKSAASRSEIPHGRR